MSGYLDEELDFDFNAGWIVFVFSCCPNLNSAVWKRLRPLAALTWLPLGWMRRPGLSMHHRWADCTHITIKKSSFYWCMGFNMRSYLAYWAAVELLSEKAVNVVFPAVFQEHDRQYMHIGTMVEFAFALVGKLDVINKHSFNDFKLRVGEMSTEPTLMERQSS